MRCGSLSVLLPLLFVLRRRGAAKTPLMRRDILVLPLLGIGGLTAHALFAATSALGQVSIISMRGSLYAGGDARPGARRAR